MANKTTNPFGSMTSLREVVINPDNSIEFPKTRSLLISEILWRRFISFSKKYYTNPETYEKILLDLIDNFEKNNPNRNWYNSDR